MQLLKTRVESKNYKEIGASEMNVIVGENYLMAVPSSGIITFSYCVYRAS
jgi:hypothetical protein